MHRFVMNPQYPDPARLEESPSTRWGTTAPGTASRGAWLLAGGGTAEWLAVGSEGGQAAPSWHVPLGSATCSRGAAVAAAAAAAAAAADFAAGVNLDEQFKCPICLEVCEKAVETPCCHNLFCRSCLLPEEHRIDHCPICKHPLQGTQIRENVPVQRMIADMPCSCRFAGCDAQLVRRNRAQHEAWCDFMPVRCPFSNQCPSLLRCQLPQHEGRDCPYRPIPCPEGCGSQVPFIALKDHLSQECPRVLCTCRDCEVQVCRQDFEEHRRSICPRAPVLCNFLEHETTERCPFRCLRQRLADHQKECLFRPVCCQHDGCDFRTTARLLLKHEDECQWRLLSCPDCSEEVRLGALQEHFELDCPEHLVPCPLAPHGCRHLVPRRLVAEHLQESTGKHLALLCMAVTARDREIETLKTEVLRTREEYEQRLTNLERLTRRQSPVSPGTGAGPFLIGVPNLEQAVPLLWGPPHVGGHPSIPMHLARAAQQRAPMTPAPPPPPPVPGHRAIRIEHPDPNSAVPDDITPESPGISDFPGPTWDRDVAMSPPGALQPLMLLREGGVSQVPVLLPSRGGGAGMALSTAPLGFTWPQGPWGQPSGRAPARPTSGAGPSTGPQAGPSPNPWTRANQRPTAPPLRDPVLPPPSPRLSPASLALFNFVQHGTASASASRDRMQGPPARLVRDEILPDGFSPAHQGFGTSSSEGSPPLGPEPPPHLQISRPPPPPPPPPPPLPEGDVNWQ